jgi:hypothetical protein
MENSSAALPLVRQRQIIYSQKTWVGFFMDLFLTTMPLVIGGMLSMCCLFSLSFSSCLSHNFGFLDSELKSRPC